MENYSESKRVYIRKLLEEDYPIYREVTYSHFSYKNVFTEKFMQVIWKEVNAAKGLACATVEKAQERFAASVSLKMWILLHQKSALTCEMTIWAEDMHKKQ